MSQVISNYWFERASLKTFKGCHNVRKRRAEWPCFRDVYLMVKEVKESPISQEISKYWFERALWKPLNGVIVPASVALNNPVLEMCIWLWQRWKNQLNPKKSSSTGNQHSSVWTLLFSFFFISSNLTKVNRRGAMFYRLGPGLSSTAYTIKSNQVFYLFKKEM